MRFRFVAGKGGVGKTTLAAARAVTLAERGGRVLVVSTDPAHSLGDALDLTTPLTGEPREVAPNLLAAELAAGPAYARWLGERREAFRTLAERGTWLAPDDIARLLDLPVPGVDELVGLLELVRLASESECDRVVVDTAPTAHTLRLLAMPAALERLAALLAALRDRHRAVADAFAGGAWRGDDADAAADALAAEARELGELIRDPERARFTWVLLPEELSLAESEDALAALTGPEGAGARVDEVVVNRVATPREDGEPACHGCEARRRARIRAEAEVIRRLGELAPAGAQEGIEVLAVPEAGDEPRGAEALRSLWASRVPVAELDLPEAGPPEPPASGDTPPPGLTEWLKAPPAWLDLLTPPERRLLMLGGKGGVGKTTCAAAIALLAARAAPGRPVLLLSTDPAHSLGDVLEMELSDEETEVAGLPNLAARELDAPAAFARLEERLRQDWGSAVETAFSGLSRGARGVGAPLDRAVVERLFEATPPGLDELVALSELTDLTASPDEGDGRRLVIVDTAPTGHALRLLELPEIALAWDHALLSILLEYREAVGLPEGLARELVDLSKSLKRLRALLADPERSGFAVVTRAGELPLRETRRLLASLDSLGTAVPAVIVNAVPDGDCPRCRRRPEPADEPGRPAILTAPAEYPPPRGPRALERWAFRWSRLAPAGASLRPR